MKYFFIPGRLKNLSWKELDSVCKIFFAQHQYILTNKDNYHLLDIDLEISEIFPRLGGFLKYGVLLDENFSFVDLIETDRKTVFGISSYSSEYDSKKVRLLAQEIKKTFATLDAKARFVLPKKGNSLNTAQVIKNRILQEGFELVALGDAFGKTMAVQDMDKFVSREYAKPFVDTQMGVLPLKLARMMVNYAEIPVGGNLWDPFCGSGNILLEGLDLGYNVIGSDIDEKALDGTSKNLNWAIKNFKYENSQKVFFLDILNPSRSKTALLQDMGIDGIVCEPFMGEAQRRVLNPEKAHLLIKQHLNLVRGLFENLNLLKFNKSIKIVVVFPEYKTKKGWISVDRTLLNFKNAKLLTQKDLHWSRRDSIIKRLIFIFEYKFK